MFLIDTEEAESTENKPQRHRDTETQRISVSPWLIILRVLRPAL